MVHIYTSNGCASCRKAKQWLNEQEIPYVETNIFQSAISEQELRYLLMRSENGTDDLISKRSKIIAQMDLDIDEMPLNDLIHFIKQNPSVLKRPILVSENSFQVGYDAEDISVFSDRRSAFVS